MVSGATIRMPGLELVDESMSTLPLDAIEVQTRQPGKVYRLTVRRGGQHRELTLTTRRLI